MAGTFQEEYDALSARIGVAYDAAQAKGAVAPMPSTRDTYMLSSYISSIPSYRHVSDYVQIGLVLCWDGIENAGVGVHASHLSSLYDHSGNGYSGVIYYQAGGGSMTPALSAEVFNNGVHVFGSCAMIQAGGTREVLSALTNQEITVEVLMERLDYDQDGRWSIWACATGSGNVSTNIARAYCIATDTPRIMRWKNEYVNLPTPSGSLPSCTMGTMTFIGKPRGFEQWLNGQLVLSYDQNNENTSTGQTNFRVGGWGGFNGTSSNFNFHCVRVYNRILTPAEIAYNRAVDEARFNIQTQISAQA